jgi:tetratricopeptide (TPR) repeat protein
MYLFKRDYKQAQEIYNRAFKTDNKIYQLRARFYQAIALQLQGKFQQTIDALYEILKPYKPDNYKDESYPVDIHRIVAFTYQAIGKTDMAIKEIEKFMNISRFYNPEDVVNDRFYYIQFLAENGQLARAEEILASLKKDIIDNKLPMCGYNYGRGALEFAQKNYDSAAVYFKKLYDLNSMFPFGFMYAKSLTMAGKYEEAIEEFEKLLKIYDINWRLCLGNMSNELHYYLGLAYENTGQYDIAVKHYKIFLDILKNADPGIELIEDAKKRISKIAGQV